MTTAAASDSLPLGLSIVTLHDLEAKLAGAREHGTDAQRLRAWIANALRGLAADHVAKAACKDRLLDAKRRLSTHAGGSVSWDQFYRALMATVEAAGDRAFYQRDELLSADTELPAVTFQVASDAALAAWMPGPSTPAGLAAAVRSGNVKPDAMVGLPGRAVWLTPLKGEVEATIDQARDGVSPDLVARLRSRFAASHWRPLDTVVAMISRENLGSLLFEAAGRDGSVKTLAPLGSTVLEARNAVHFRHWPAKRPPIDPYGRTYDLDPVERTKATLDLSYGAPEAVRSPMRLSAFKDCVVIGQLTPEACAVADVDLDYLRAVDGERPLADLLRDLVTKLG